MPYLVRIPLGPNGIVVKAKQTWPREKKIYCHRAEGWPADAEIVERLSVRTCTRRGPAIDLILNRARENRSQFVIAQARGREMIFWQSPRTTKQARPAVRIPTARAHGQVLEIVVDTAEKYPYAFNGQQATTTRRRLPAGDYAVLIDEQVVAAVERKTLEDLAGSLLSGKLTYALAELSALPRAAVVVEDRYSRLFKMEHAPGARVAESLAEAQARFASVPIVFCETRPLAQEWTYRWLGACLSEMAAAQDRRDLDLTFASGSPVMLRPVAEPRAVATPSGGVDAAAVRRWARQNGLPVNDRGRLAAGLVQSYLDGSVIRR